MTTTTDFDPQAQFEPDAAVAAWHRLGCSCATHSRRLFGRAVLGAGAALAMPAWALVMGQVVSYLSGIPLLAVTAFSLIV